MVKWIDAGVTYNLDVEFEDTQLFQEVDGNVDMDTTEGGGPSGGQDKGANHSSSEVAKGPAAQPGKTDESAKGSAQTPTSMNMLRFGSFAASSTPSRLWCHKVELDNSSEHVLPLVPTEDCLTMTVGAPRQEMLEPVSR